MCYISSMLEQLSKKNSKWLSMALKICGDIQLSKDLVQDMYIKIYDLNEDKPIKEIKDAFIWGMLRGMFIDKCRKDSRVKIVGLDSIFNMEDKLSSFELDDEDLKLLDRSKELRYLYRYYLEKNYDYSIRTIAEINNVNYGKVHRKLKVAREHILKDDFHKYKNKRKKR